MKYLLFMLLSICTYWSMGQSSDGLILEYNLHENTVKYIRNGATIDKANIKDGENLYVHIVEFNPYIMKAEVNVNNGSYAQSSYGLQSDGLSGVSGVGLGGISSLLGGLSLGSDVQGIFDGIPGSRGASQIDVIKATNKFESLVSQLSIVEQKMNTSKVRIKKFELVDASRTLAASDIAKLKSNRHIKPSRIKKMIEEEIYHSFAKDHGSEVDINDLINGDQLHEDLQDAVATYNSARSQYFDLATEWKDFKGVVSLIDIDENDVKFDYLKHVTDSIVTQLDENINNKLSEPVSIELTEANQTENAEMLATFRRVLEEIQSDIFTYKFPPVQASGDMMDVSIHVKIKDEDDSYEDYKTLHQELDINGGWKLSAGIGLAFGVLKDQAYDYSTLNGKIVATENDAFTPMITSFAHIYKQTSSSINLGGSFGIGYPLSDGGGVSSVSFFVGPTIVVGRKQKFLISGGLMGAKVNRLGGGLEVGDDFDTFSGLEVPLASRYELGYYISISYDLLK